MRTSNQLISNIMRFRSVLLTATLFSAFLPTGLTQTYQLLDWSPDNRISVMLKDTATNKVFFGGMFSSISDSHSNSVVLDVSTGQKVETCVSTNGAVYASVSDENGGWYIGGLFSKVGDSIRRNIAHLDSNGRPTDRFRHNGFNNSVRSLLLFNGKLLVGGNFNRYGNDLEGRPYLYLCDTLEGNPLPNFPTPNMAIITAVDDKMGGWYISGYFHRIGDSIREGLAYITPEGYVGKFIASVQGFINTMVYDNGMLYVGGEFSKIGDSIRNNIGCINTATGEATSWKPEADKKIRDILVTDSVVYIAGDFYGTGGASRRYLAAINKANGKSTNWSPTIYGEYVNKMAIYGNLMYISGIFTNLNNLSISRLAAINLSTGTPVQLWINPNQNVNSLAIKDSLLYLGGEFSLIGSMPRNNLAAINLKNNTVTDWNPNANAAISSLAISGSKIFVSGNFDSIGQQPAQSVAALLIDGSLDAWRIHVEPEYYLPMLYSNSSSILISCRRFFPEHSECESLAEINLATEELSPNIPLVMGSVSTMKILDQTLYFGGSFSMVGNQKRNNIASINLANNNLLPFNPPKIYDLSPKINSIDIANNRLYVGGTFSGIGTFDRAGLAALDPISGAVLPWKPDFDSFQGDTYCIKADDGFLYASGYYYDGYDSKQGIARYDLLTGESDGWSPTTDRAFYSILPLDNVIFAGGSPTYDTVHTETGLMCFDKNTGAWIEKNQTLRGVPYTLCKNSGKLFVGGSINGTKLLENKGLGAFDLNTLKLEPWCPKADQWVASMAKHKNSLYVGGNFSEINGISCRGLAKIDALTGAVDTSWKPKLDSGYYNVDHLIHFNDMVIASGYFDTINGLPCNGIIALDTLTGALLDWHPDLSPSSVNALALHDSILYLGGHFSSYNGLSRNNGVALKLPGFIPTNWNPVFNSGISSFYATDTAILMQTFAPINPYSSSSVLQALDYATGNQIIWEFPLVNFDTPQIAESNDTMYFSGEFDGSHGYTSYYITGQKRLGQNILDWIPLEAENPSDDYAYTSSMVTNSSGIIASGHYHQNHMNFANVIYIPIPPARPGVIDGVANPCPAMNGNTYSVPPTPNTQYTWSYTGQGANIVSGQGTHAIVVDFDSAATPGFIVVKPFRDGAAGNGQSFRVDFSPIIPSKPVGNNLVDLLLTPTSNYFCNNLGADASISWTLQPDSLGTLTHLADTALITWLKTGTAQLFARVDYTCGTEYSDTLTIVVKNASATPEIAINNPRVTPNPFNRLLTLEIPAGQTATKVELFDITGNLIFSLSGDLAGKKVLDPGSLPKGIYLLRVAGGNVWTTKLVCY